ncbi:hypothetical protein Cpir12675_002464 [Ceratocystis pirilliformis]|uniref:Uncharacterized protein n=1 Tax=Ceratocystis pirilliformis TaxID=259994 RepID=A0ABR3ZAQ9_9PEZI
MSPSTPTAGGMSSKVLTMKFMQRAAASATSGESSPIDQSSRESSHSAKKRRLANGSANTATTAEETAAAVKTAVKEMEDRQQAAMERHVENTADTHWVLPEVAKQLPSKPALNVLVVGWNTTYGEDSDVEADMDDPKIGRTQSPAYRLAAEAAATAESAKQEDSDSDSGSDSNAETRGTSGKYKKMKKITSISGRANFDTPPKKAFGGPVASPRSGGSASSLKRQRKMSVEDLRGKELRDRRLRKEVRGSQMSRSNGGGDGHSPFGQRSRH